MTDFDEGSERSLFDKGMSIRRAVLGDDNVDRSLAQTDNFLMAIQEVGTSFGWGVGWGDEAVDRKTRSLANLAMLTALNRNDEFKAHVHGALINGASVAEIKAILIQATVYCGVPAGVSAFKAAHEVLMREGVI